MSGQLLELIIFATVAIILCNKLISLVGKTSDRSDEGQSFFGESDIIKDVAYKEVSKDLGDINRDSNPDSLKNVIDLENKDFILKGYKNLKNILPDFQLKHFLYNSKKALKMIIDEKDSGEGTLLKLVDKNYIGEFRKLSNNYNQIVLNNLQDVSAKISEIGVFGNNVFIKVMFVSTNIGNTNNSFNEEWTFSKNSTKRDKIWFLTNIDKM